MGSVAGGAAEWRLAPSWSVRPVFAGGVSWRGRRAGWSSRSRSATARIDYDQKLLFDRLGLPLRAAFRPGAGRAVLECGLDAAWIGRVARDADLAITSTTTPPSPVQPDAAIFEQAGTFDARDWTHVFHRWDLAAAAGVGWDFPVGYTSRGCGRAGTRDWWTSGRSRTRCACGRGSSRSAGCGEPWRPGVATSLPRRRRRGHVKRAGHRGGS